MAIPKKKSTVLLRWLTVPLTDRSGMRGLQDIAVVDHVVAKRIRLAHALPFFNLGMGNQNHMRIIKIIPANLIENNIYISI